jgi:hypothetical protein
VGRDLQQRPAVGADQGDVPLAHDQPGDLDLAGVLVPAAEVAAAEVASSGHANAQHASTFPTGRKPNGD